MSLTTQGQKGERLARLFLKDMNFTSFMQMDWIAERHGKYYQFEVKCKEMFIGPPFDGHGLEKYQAERRLQFQSRFGIRCGFIVFDGSKIFYQWLDVLWEKQKHITKNGIVIFPVANFNYKDNPCNKI